jgi:hypothetical protein
MGPPSFSGKIYGMIMSPNSSSQSFSLLPRIPPSLLSAKVALPNLYDLFSLPLSQEAFQQFQQLSEWFTGWQPTDNSDIWTYIWGSLLFSTTKAYKALIGHRRIHPLFKWIWKANC